MPRFTPLLGVLLLAGCYESHGLTAPDGGDALPDAADVPEARDDAGLPDTDGREDGGAPDGVLFRLRFVSDIPESLWLNETDVAWDSHWLRLARDGVFLHKAAACEVCPCDDCPDCPVCGEPCPTAIEVPSGSFREYWWDGYEFPREPCPSATTSTCQRERAAPDGAYTATFCWSATYTGTPPCPAEVGELICQDVPFTLPDPDGVVEYLINNGG